MRYLAVVLTCFILSACGSGSPVDSGGDPNAPDVEGSVIEPVTSTDTVAAKGDTVRVVVRVLDEESGEGRGGIRVQFRANRDGCGHFESGNAQTNRLGRASDFWQVGDNTFVCRLSVSTIGSQGELVETVRFTVEVQPGQPHRHIFDDRAFRRGTPLVLPEDAWRDRMNNEVHVDYRVRVDSGPAHVMGSESGTEAARTVIADTVASTFGASPDTIASGSVTVLRADSEVATGQMYI